MNAQTPKTSEAQSDINGTVSEKINEAPKESRIRQVITVTTTKIKNSKALQAIGSFFKRIGQSLCKPIGTLSVLKMMLIFFLAVAITVGIGVFKAKSKPIARDQVNFVQLDPLSQVKAFKRTHNKYLSMTPEDRLIFWIITFRGWDYQENGDPKYKKADCVGAVYTYFQNLGSNIRLESVPWIAKRIANLEERELIKTRKTVTAIQSGDIIVMKFSEANQHVGIVYDVCNNGLIRYMDINVGTYRWGLESIRWGSPNITVISEVNFSLWIGDLLQEFNNSPILSETED